MRKASAGPGLLQCSNVRPTPTSKKAFEGRLVRLKLRKVLNNKGHNIIQRKFSALPSKNITGPLLDIHAAFTFSISLVEPHLGLVKIEVKYSVFQTFLSTKLCKLTEKKSLRALKNIVTCNLTNSAIMFLQQLQ